MLGGALRPSDFTGRWPSGSAERNFEVTYRDGMVSTRAASEGLWRLVAQIASEVGFEPWDGRACARWGDGLVLAGLYGHLDRGNRADVRRFSLNWGLAIPNFRTSSPHPVGPFGPWAGDDRITRFIPDAGLNEDLYLTVVHGVASLEIGHQAATWDDQMRNMWNEAWPEKPIEPFSLVIEDRSDIESYVRALLHGPFDDFCRRYATTTGVLALLDDPSLMEREYGKFPFAAAPIRTEIAAWLRRETGSPASA